MARGSGKLTVYEALPRCRLRPLQERWPRRWIDDVFRFRMNRIGVFLCDKCYRALIQADARAWEWFAEVSRPNEPLIRFLL